MRFVIVTTKRGPTPEVDNYLARPDIEQLPWRARAHVRWSSESGRVHLSAWSADEAASMRAGPKGVVGYAGMPRPARGEWPTGLTALDIIESSTTLGRWSPHRELADAYALLRIDGSGRGIVANDPLGLHPLYVTQTADSTIVGNRVDLVGEVAARSEGTTSQRDLRSAAWLAYAQQIVGSGTGLRDVALAPQHSIGHIDDRGINFRASPPLWAPAPGEVPTDPDDVGEQLNEALISGLRHAVAHSRGRPTLHLTGGKDSRLILAAALDAGIADQFRIGTFGPPDLPDMRVGRGLCQALGLEHHDLTAEHYDAAAQFDVEERLRRHVHRTSGTAYCGDANEPPTHDAMTVSGVMGEIWRTAVRSAAMRPAQSCQGAVEQFDSDRGFGRAGLVPATLGTELQHEAHTHLLAQSDCVVAPHDLRGAYILSTRWPRWFGPVVDQHDRTSRVFYHPLSIRAAFAMGFDHRTAETVHHSLISRHRVLRDHPFANDSWRDPAVSSPDPVVGPPTVRQVTTDPTATTALAETVRRLEHTSDPDNAVYDIVDRPTLRALAADFDQLPLIERGQFLGAVTALIWLGHGELRPGGA